MSHESGEFVAREVVKDNGRILRWKRSVLKGSHYVEVGRQ